MKFRTALMFAMAAASVTAAHAEDLKIARNARLISADGAVIGRIDRVLTTNDKVSGVQLIVGSKMVVIPGDTLSADEAGVKTSLTKKEVRSLR